MKLTSYVIGAAAGLVLALGVSQVRATPLTVGVGWLQSEVAAANVTGPDSPFTFTASGPGILSVSDCCIVGDLWTVSGDLSGTSSYGLLPVNFPTGLGDTTYDANWLDPTLSHLQIAFGPGIYQFDIIGDGGANVFPAHFGVRVDLATPIPAALPLFASGLGALGLIAYRRKRKQAA